MEFSSIAKEIGKSRVSLSVGPFFILANGFLFTLSTFHYIFERSYKILKEFRMAIWSDFSPIEFQFVLNFTRHEKRMRAKCEKGTNLDLIVRFVTRQWARGHIFVDYEGGENS